MLHVGGRSKFSERGRAFGSVGNSPTALILSKSNNDVSVETLPLLYYDNLTEMKNLTNMNHNRHSNEIGSSGKAFHRKESTFSTAEKLLQFKFDFLMVCAFTNIS